MGQEIKDISYENKRLKMELEQQRGMIWLLGEIIREGTDILQFKRLMMVLTDMIMGVMGVTTCYLWSKAETGENRLEDYTYEYSSLKSKGQHLEKEALEEYTLYFRSIELNNEFKSIESCALPYAIKHLKRIHVFKTEEIEGSLISEVSKPGSRIVVPLKDFQNGNRFGYLVLEHKEKDFFTANNITFFETLSIYIASSVENSKLLQRVSDQSVRDPLTETYNRSFLKQSLQTVKANYSHITVGVIDIDNFKIINDELGHIQGDTVLKAIAQLAKGIVEDYNGDVIRYGGDEFIIVLPMTLEEGVYVLEQFRKSVYYLQVVHELKTSISVTIGVCAYPELTEKYKAIIEKADYALIKGKTKGKNVVWVAEP